MYQVPLTPAQTEEIARKVAEDLGYSPEKTEEYVSGVVARSQEPRAELLKRLEVYPPSPPPPTGVPSPTPASPTEAPSPVEQYAGELERAGLTTREVASITANIEYIQRTSRTPEEAQTRFGEYMTQWEPVIAKRAPPPELKKPVSLKLMEAAHAFPEKMSIGIGRFPKPIFDLGIPEIRGEDIIGAMAMGGSAIVGTFEELGMSLAGMFKRESVAGYAPAPSPFAIAMIPEYREKYWPGALIAAPIIFPLEAKAMGAGIKLVGMPIKTVVQAPFKALAKIAPPAVKTELKLHQTIARVLGVRGEYVRIYTPAKVGATQILGPEEQFRIKYITTYKGTKIVPLTDSMRGLYKPMPWAQIRIDVGKIFKPYTEPISVRAGPYGWWQTVVPEEQIVSFETQILKMTGKKAAEMEIFTWVKYPAKVEGAKAIVPFKAFDPAKFYTMKPFAKDIKGGISSIQRLMQRQKIFYDVQPPTRLFYTPVTPAIESALARGIASALGVGVVSAISFEQAQKLQLKQIQGLTEMQKSSLGSGSAAASASAMGAMTSVAQAQRAAQAQRVAQAQQLAQVVQVQTQMLSFKVPPPPFGERELKKHFLLPKVKKAKFRPFERVWPVGRIERLFEAPKTKARKAKGAFDARELERAFKPPKTGRRR